MKALALLCLAASLGAEAQEQARASPGEIQNLYDQAFKYYASQQFARAIQQWEEVLKFDPKQASAQKMISRAREELAEASRPHLRRLKAHIRQGRYQTAILDLQPLLDKDPANPDTLALQERLEKVAALVREAPTRTKAWRMAVLGLSAYLDSPEKMQLAYDALRYARELDPAERKFPRLLELLVATRPSLAEDTVTPGMKLIDYKLLVGLNHIYDGKHHLAVEVLNQALALEPKNVIALKRLGSAYFALGKRMEAKEAWSRALKLTPKDEELKGFLAQTEKSSRPKPTSKRKKTTAKPSK